MSVAVIFALILAFIFLMIRKNDHRYGIFSFMGCGVLAWIRPELAFVFAFALIGIYIYKVIQKAHTFISTAQIICAILIPLSIFIGSIPFFINNSMVTGDPLLPPYAFMVERGGSTDQSSLNSLSEIPIEDKQSNTQKQYSLITFIFKYFKPKWDTILQDIGKILFAPTSGMIGVFAICPLFFIGIALLVLRTVIHPLKSKNCFYNEIIICLIAIIAVFIAYFSDFHGMIISEGIGPDMRYLSPVYIPGGLLGLLILRESPLFQIQNKILFRQTVCTLLILTPVIFLGLLFLPPFGGGFSGFTQFTTLGVVILSVLFLLLQIIQCYLKPSLLINRLTFALILALPLTWNIILVIMFSVTRSNGYPFWLPVLEHIYNIFIIPVG